MSTVGIKDLKLHLRRYVNRAAKGETITVTARGNPVAMIVPLPPGRLAVEAMKRSGRMRGHGTNPLGLLVKRKPRRDPDLAVAVLEGRNR